MVAVQVIINRFELLNIQQKNSIPNIFIMGTVIPIRYRINCGVIGKINTGCVDIPSAAASVLAVRCSAPSARTIPSAAAVISARVNLFFGAIAVLLYVLIYNI